MKLVLTLATVVLLAVAPAAAQTVEVITFDELEQRMADTGDTVVVFNFWATWCKPCIEEMPAFDSLHRVYAGRKVRVVFVSLDFMSQIDRRVRPFLKKRSFAPPVVVLNAPNANEWIDRISPDWSGAIPATLVVSSARNIRSFYEREFTFDELQSLIQPLVEDQ